MIIYLFVFLLVDVLTTRYSSASPCERFVVEIDDRLAFRLPSEVAEGKGQFTIEESDIHVNYSFCSHLMILPEEVKVDELSCLNERFYVIMKLSVNLVQPELWSFVKYTNSTAEKNFTGVSKTNLSFFADLVFSKNWGRMSTNVKPNAVTVFKMESNCNDDPSFCVQIHGILDNKVNAYLTTSLNKRIRDTISGIRW